jgi:predicted nucleotidyltransferase
MFSERKLSMTNSLIKKATADLKSALTKKYGTDIELILFGSALTGNYSNESDIDILVLVPFEIDNSLEEEIIGEAFEIELKYNVVFGIIIYSNEFWNSDIASAMPLHKNIHSGISL